jgi:hypothetical protein
LAGIDADDEFGVKGGEASRIEARPRGAIRTRAAVARERPRIVP